MVTLDRDGRLLLWPYRRDHHSDYGWFRPSKEMQVGLTTRMLTLDPDNIQLHFPPEGLQVPKRGPRGYPKKYLTVVRRYEAHYLAPLRLPEQPWKTVRLDSGLVRKTYGEPQSVDDERGGAFASVTRDEDGTLVRHTTSLYRWTDLRGELAAACLSPSGRELAVLTYFGGVPATPQLQLQLLKLSTLTWLPLKVNLQPQPAPLALLPRQSRGPSRADLLRDGEPIGAQPRAWADDGCYRDGLRLRAR